MKLFFFFHSALSLRWAQTSILLYEYVKLHVHWGYRQILFGLFRIGLSQVKLQISFYFWTIISLYKYCCRIIGGTSWRRFSEKGFNRVVTKQFLRFLRHKNQAKVDYKCVKIIAKILLSRNQKAKVAKETLGSKPPAPGFVVNCVAEGTRLTFPS